MANETRSVVVRLRAEANGFIAEFDRAGRASDRLANNVGRSDQSLGRLIRTARNIALSAGLGAAVTSAVRLEAAYSKTMAQVAVATKAPQAELKELDRLALKLGADTVFSAQDAANAMLQLAKGGLTTAQIKAGALAETMTLAAAGGIDLGEAADVVVQAMGAFRLRADQSNVAVAALAGGANSSSASLDDMTQALRQVGTSANAAHLSIQDTTAFLALFADQGIKGSDAGTSFRTMLTRLVPQTDEAKNAMDRLGLSYVDGNGQLVDAEEIARRTQDAFKGLNDEERIRATNAIFGADAQRAVNALTAEGDEGLRKYLKSTNDLTQAQKLAEAANSGTAGAIERLKGSAETAGIQIGRGLAPVVQELAEQASDLIESGDLEGWARSAGAGISDFIDEVTPLAKSLGTLAQEAFPAVATAGGVVVDVLELAADVVTPLVNAFNKLPDSAQQALILAGGAKVLSNRMGGIPGISRDAGSGLLFFGGSATKAGDDAGKAGKKFSAFTTSLKGNAALIAAFVGGGAAIDALDNVKRSLRDVEGFKGLDDAFSGTNVSKHAGDLGINLDKLAASIRKGGGEGEYLKQVLTDLDATTSDGSGVLSLKTAVDGLTFGLTGLNAIDASNVKDDLLEIVEAYEASSAAAQQSAEDQKNAVNETRNELLLASAGIDEYRDVLRGIPTQALTQILAPGAAETRDQVFDLTEAYNLTPEQVVTLMKALDFATPDIQAVLARMIKLDLYRAFPFIGVKDQASNRLQAIRAYIASLKNKTITIETIYKRTIIGGRGNPGVFGLNQYAGGRVPQGFASGGLVPGIAPPQSNVDNVFAMGLNGGPLLVRSGEWIINEQSSRKNDLWLRAMNNGLDLTRILGSPDSLMGRYPVMRAADGRDPMLRPSIAMQPGGSRAMTATLDLTDVAVGVDERGIGRFVRGQAQVVVAETGRQSRQNLTNAILGS